jgi:SAM-dependent methyltransferase
MMDKIKTLSERQKSEIEFHDKKAEKETNKNFYNQGAITPAYERLMTIAGDLTNKKLLDFGCGQGWSSVNYAKKGADVTGVDISLGSLKKAIEASERAGLSRTPHFIQASCENLPLKDKFDVIIGIAILHHLDLGLAVNSIKGSLKSGGKAIFMEPLDHNPLINLFRRLTPDRRTEDEKPLDYDFIQALKKHFSEVRIHGYGLISLFALFFSFIKAYAIFRKVNNSLSHFERKIFRKVPKLQKYCWGAIIELEK